MTDDTTDDTNDDAEKSPEEKLLETVEAAVEKLDDLDEKVDALDERVDKVAKGAADTDQIEGGEAETSEKISEAEAFKAALGGN